MQFSELEKISIKNLTGVGPKAKEAYENLGIETFADLLSFAPKAYEDRSHRICIGRQVPGGQWTNTVVEVES